MAVLEAKGIVKRFGGLTAVSEASLAAQGGRITALIGPNGAGKTTLFAVVAGFLEPDAGSVHFDGRDITGLAPPRICRLGLVRTFQIVQPFGALTVRENIAVGSHLHERARRKALAQAEKIARQVGMEAQLDMPAQGLTVAGRKRLELARALATQPKLLLLDEVMAGLTPTEVNEIVGVIRRIRDSGVTLLLIEHVMQAVMSLSDDVYVLNQGRIIAHGSPRDIASDPEVIQAYLGRRAVAHA
ncbi:MAG TPA: ABC transporter ATP-binding protein [Burkholderiales bacterium]|jgi:branched-chain amino acid transport system ATP-binding protein